MRLFVGLPATALADALAPMVQDLRALGARTVPEANLHVTVRFLGEVDDSAASRVRDAAACASEATPPFALRFGTVTGFPSPRRPRVAVVTAAPCTVFTALKYALETALEREGFTRERRAARPHVTLARGVEGCALPERSITVDLACTELVVFESILGPGGAVYKPIVRFALAGQPT